MEHKLANPVGIVSNCWKAQLQKGESLHDLISQTRDTEFSHVELRQGCMGHFENSDKIPDAEALATLASEFPDISFNLAVELPIFSKSIDTTSNAVKAMIQAAKNLSQPPHLRIVDVTATFVPHSQAPGFSIENVLASFSSLQAALGDGVISVEHAFQPWADIERFFEVSHELVTPVKLCYDACNLGLTNEINLVSYITESIPGEWLALVHLKQRVGEAVLPKLGPGDVDWKKQLTLLSNSNYAGPLLFEINPSDEVAQCLTESLSYLRSIHQK